MLSSSDQLTDLNAANATDNIMIANDPMIIAAEFINDNITPNIPELLSASPSEVSPLNAARTPVIVFANTSFSFSDHSTDLNILSAKDIAITATDAINIATAPAKINRAPKPARPISTPTIAIVAPNIPTSSHVTLAIFHIAIAPLNRSIGIIANIIAPAPFLINLDNKPTSENAIAIPPINIATVANPDNSKGAATEATANIKIIDAILLVILLKALVPLRILLEFFPSAENAHTKIFIANPATNIPGIANNKGIVAKVIVIPKSRSSFPISPNPLAPFFIFFNLLLLSSSPNADISIFIINLAAYIPGIAVIKNGVASVTVVPKTNNPIPNSFKAFPAFSISFALDPIFSKDPIKPSVTLRTFLEFFILLAALRYLDIPSNIVLTALPVVIVMFASLPPPLVDFGFELPFLISVNI